MSAPPSPLLGFNNNVRHKGRIFHIQTEDSGVKHPHVITHLFMDGGRIVKTQKTSYAEHVGQKTMAETVRTLMKQQHKAMFIALRDGLYDELIEKKASARSQPAMEAPALSEESKVQPIVAAPPVEPPPVSEAAPATTRDAPIDLDVAAIERAAAAAARDGKRPSVMPVASDLPPPPPEVLHQKQRDAGGYREVSTPDGRREPSKRPPPPARPISSRPRATPPAPPQSSGKYAVSRPASLFTSNRPPEGRSIFGEDLISEKSLDEVILSYLAEDLDAPPPKK